MQAAECFARAKAKAKAKAKGVQLVAVCWKQPQWHSPVMVQPLESPQVGRTQVVEVANSWAVGVAGAVEGECQVWLLPKERLPRGL